MKKLLKANKKLFENLQINIFGLLSTQNQKIYAYETGMGKRESDNILNLLSIPLQNTEGLEEGEKVKTQQHLVVINDLDTFMLQKTGKKGSNRTRRKLCLKCFNFFKDDTFIIQYFRELINMNEYQKDLIKGNDNYYFMNLEISRIMFRPPSLSLNCQDS